MAIGVEEAAVTIRNFIENFFRAKFAAKTL
jgi:hypothetical protein